MKLPKILPALLFVLCLGGCVRSAYQPSPPAHRLWYPQSMSETDAERRMDAYWGRDKKGDDLTDQDLDVQKALLECGAPEPFEIPYGSISDDEISLVQLCMLKSGYRYIGRFGTVCERSYLRDKLPSCKFSHEDIPGRDINKRLHGKFCSHKLYSAYKVCQP